MPRYIIKLDTPSGPRYMEWSTIVDAPVTYGMTLDDFKVHCKEHYDIQGMLELPELLERVENTGTSCLDETLAETISCNRAGPNGEELTLEQIVNEFCPMTARDTADQEDLRLLEVAALRYAEDALRRNGRNVAANECALLAAAMVRR